MTSSLINHLTILKKCGAMGVKTSFEDEGADPINVYKLRNITNKVGLDLNLKIGGVEAKTDFNLAMDIGVDGVVAPMVESEFALSKFTSFSKEYEVSTFRQHEPYRLSLYRSGRSGFIIEQRSGIY